MKYTKITGEKKASPGSASGRHSKLNQRTHYPPARNGLLASE
jgi:hypothetical protein